MQVVRDWVLRFNGSGPAGLIDRKAPGKTALLTDEHVLGPAAPAAEGSGRDAAAHLGAAELPQGRPAEPPDAEAARLLRHPHAQHVPRGGLCYEPFSGSGSQIMAGEANGRQVHAMEISPACVDVAVERWQLEPGRAAALDGDSRSFAEVKQARIGSGVDPEGPPDEVAA